MIEELRRRAGGRVALLVGNGIHLYPNGGNSWNALVERLARNNGFASPERAKNLAMPEFYDLIDLGRSHEGGPKSASQAYPLKKQFCDGMEEWKPAEHHLGIVEWAKRNGSPILTTNFDLVLSSAAGAKRFSMFRPHGSRKRESDYYTWWKYFASEPLNHAREGFGIWHINGFISHIRSIRLGLSDYMGCVEHSRPWIMKARSFPDWSAEDTWLDVLFKMPLVVFGVGLEGQEVWLRWLLIQRAALHKRRGIERPPAWYVYPAEENDERQREKRFFLKCLGVEPYEVADYSAIYDPRHWAG